MRKKPNTVAEFVRVAPPFDGWQWATYRFPCGHEREYQYPAHTIVPKQRRLYHECGLSSVVADAALALHGAQR